MSADVDTSAAETKLAAARTRLILEKPFLGALVLRLPMNAAKPEWCPTTATDARAFYYNPEYIGQLSLDETQFMLAHEALHCALSHFARRRHRVRHKWDLACDYAINPLLDPIISTSYEVGTKQVAVLGGSASPWQVQQRVEVRLPQLEIHPLRLQVPRLP